MGKKRGGKNRLVKKDEEEEEVEPLNVEPIEFSTEEDAADKKKHKLKYSIIERARKLNETELAVMVDQLEIPSSSTKSMVESDRNVTLSIFIRRFENREIFLMTSKAGQKALENILTLIFLIFEENRAVLNSQLPASIQTKKDGDAEIDLSYFSVIEAHAFVCHMLAIVSAEPLKYAYDNDAARVMEKLLQGCALAVEFESSEDAKNFLPSGVRGASDYLLSILGKFSAECGITGVLSHPSGSFVGRALIASLAGRYVSVEASRQQPQKRKDILVPSQAITRVPEKLIAAFFTTIEEMLKSLRKDVSNDGDLELGPAYEFVSKLFKSLQDDFPNDMKEKLNSLSVDYFTVILNNAKSLIELSWGCRVLEASLAGCSKRQWKKFVKDFAAPRAADLAGAQKGNYIMQAILQCSQFLTEKELKLLLPTATAITSPFGANSVWRLCQAANRLQVLQKEVAEIIFEALDVSQVRKKFCWWCVLLLRPSKSLPREILAALGETPEERSENALIPPSGCSILIEMIKFPRSGVEDLIQSLPSFWNVDGLRHWRVKIAKDPTGSRCLESVFAPSSALNESERSCVAKSFIKGGVLRDLALHHLGSFVVSAAFSGSDHDTAKALITNLAVISEELRVRNFRLYSLLNLSTFLQDPEGWGKMKFSKRRAREVFANLLEAGPNDFQIKKQKRN